MRHHYVLRLLVALLLISTSLVAQKRLAPARITPLTSYERFAMQNRIVKADSIVCYASKVNAFTRIGPPQGFNDGRARRAATAQFIVDYVGYPDSARAAFQRAVDIWSTLIISPVPIRIRATWRALGTGVLGSASPSNYIFAPNGSQRGTTYYPIALAEKISRRDINSPDSADIVANFSSSNSWYLGLDGKPTAGKYDLVTVVLHELGHGLGFAGPIVANTTSRQASSIFPSIFETYVENALGTKWLANSFISDPSALYSQLTGQNLYLNAPILRQKTGDRARLYAPAAYNAGSSFSHLNEVTYPTGTPNALMTPFINLAEVAQNPGPIVLSFFEDMEWKTTSLLHTPQFDTESTNPIALVARVVSDTTPGANPPTLIYRVGSSTTGKQVSMVRQGTSDTFTYTLPTSELTGRVSYYIQTQDISGRTYTNPGKSYDGTVQYTYSFTVGADRVAPTVTHIADKPVILEAEVDSLLILAKVTDDRRLFNITRTKVGVDTVYMQYQVNGAVAQTVSMTLANSDAVLDSTWFALLPVPIRSLKTGAIINYRIFARDISAARNLTASPLYSISVVAPQSRTLTEYSNNFNTASTAATDFIGRGFSIQQPASFSSASINSEHPYRNGSSLFAYLSGVDAPGEASYTYTLLAPIKIASQNQVARIQYDEVVLIEPSETGSTFGSQGFYDYAIVEASKDNGLTWLPLIDGYNANAYSDWLATWNSSSSIGQEGDPISTAVGTSSLLKSRTINLLANGNFKANDVVLIRFRLYADPLTYGWGWQIDNLRIQEPIILATEPLPMASFSVYPNPASGLVQVHAELNQTATTGTLTLSSPTGQALRQLPISIQNGKQINEKLDVSQLPAGMYFLQLDAGEAKQVKKIVVTR